MYFGNTFVAGQLILSLQWAITNIYAKGMYALIIFVAPLRGVLRGNNTKYML